MPASDPDDDVRQEIPKRKLANSSPKKGKRARIPILPSVRALCDASVRITKALLALGAENNLADVLDSKGRSITSGTYRTNWLYLSKKDHSALTCGVSNTAKAAGSAILEDSAGSTCSNWYDTFSAGTPQTFFYNTSKTELRTKKNYMARNAACAVLSLSGSCDEHAFVLATLLQAILPAQTEITVCGMELKGIPFPHTFVVVGKLKEGLRKIPLADLDTRGLLAVDAWPTQGGAVKLEDFFVCVGSIDKATLIVDQRFKADGEDHLIKRVVKQKILLDIIEEKDPLIATIPASSLPSLTFTELTDQIHYVEKIKRVPSLSSNPSDYGDDMFNCFTVSATYAEPLDAQVAYDYILENYPSIYFNRCLQYVSERLRAIISHDTNDEEIDFKQRTNAGPYLDLDEHGVLS